MEAAFPTKQITSSWCSSYRARKKTGHPRMKPITIEFEIHDLVAGNHFIYENGYLMDETSAMYAGLDKGDIWLVQVVPTDKPGVYRDISGNVQLRDNEHGPMGEDKAHELIKTIYDMLNNMTAWEFARDILCNCGNETDLDLI